MQPVVRSLKILAPSMLGAKMEGSFSFLASLMRNTLSKRTLEVTLTFFPKLSYFQYLELYNPYLKNQKRPKILKSKTCRIEETQSLRILESKNYWIPKSLNLKNQDSEIWKFRFHNFKNFKKPQVLNSEIQINNYC